MNSVSHMAKTFFRAGLVSLGVQRPQTRWKTKSDLVHVILMVKLFFYAYVLWTPCKVKHLVLPWPSLYLWDKLSMMVIHSMNFPMWCTRFLIIVPNTKHFQIKISNQLAGKKPKAHYFIITIDILTPELISNQLVGKFCSWLHLFPRKFLGELKHLTAPQGSLDDQLERSEISWLKYQTYRHSQW